MSTTKRILLPLAVSLAGALLLTGLYFGIVSWAESPQHAAELFWEDRWIVFPIILGFGVQAGLYTILKMRLFVPVATTGPSGPIMGAGGMTSTIAMAACCAHHVADVLPILGLTAAATFLAQYRIAFMLVGLGTTLLGIMIMTLILIKERRKAIQMISAVASPILETL
ncbi:MAG TPA: hypothetical protein VN363_08230 [Anaerolineales bacterium]|nr:hypothetical protein [Anaerolineales bacterium]